MERRVVHAKVPPARAPLSQAIKVGEWMFASGQLGLDPRTARLVEGGTKAETRQVCENLKAVLEAAGSSLVKVVKVTIYMADLGELMAVNEIFKIAAQRRLTRKNAGRTEVPILREVFASPIGARTQGPGLTVRRFRHRINPTNQVFMLFSVGSGFWHSMGVSAL